jgi:2,3-dihydroxybenzoate-AMP ligase
MNSSEFPKHRDEDARTYTKNGWWRGLTVGDVLDRAADVFPRREALVDDTVRLTYSNLRERVDRLAVGLMNLGLKRGDAVLLQLPNWAEFPYAYFALQKIGCIPVVLISGYRQLEVGHLGRLTDAKAWIVPHLYRGFDYLSFSNAVRDQNPQLRWLISVRGGHRSPGFSADIEDLMEAEITREDMEKLALSRPEPADVCHILPSGGTTGLPKAIPRTHNDYVCNVEFQQRRSELNVNETGLICVPVCHNLALLNVVGAVFFGYRLVLLDSTRPTDIAAVVQREKITYMPTVPSLLKRLLTLTELSEYDLTSLKKINAGGEASTPELIREARQRLGCTYISEFGMSEGLLCRTRLTDDIETVCTTVGKPCCPHDQMEIRDMTGQALPPNQDGELVTKGPGIFAGYLKNPEENKKSFTEDGFFRTGDQARIDRSGNLCITGRIKDIIIRGGENISPAQVEELLSLFPGVVDAAVIGMPDRELGEKACAYIQAGAGVQLDPVQITSFLQRRGASKLLIPERFEFVEALPMTEAGKHDKKLLREDIRQKLERIQGSEKI